MGEGGFASKLTSRRTDESGSKLVHTGEANFHELELDRGLAAANRIAPGCGVNLPDTREVACKSPTTLVER